MSALPVEYEGGSPPVEPDVDFTLYLKRPLSKPYRKELEGLIEGWYMVGFYGGFFGTGFHSLSDLTFGRAGSKRVRWHLDRGNVDLSEPTQVLVRCLGRFSSIWLGGERESPQLEKLVIR